jgi:hypothetical protein
VGVIRGAFPAKRVKIANSQHSYFDDEFQRPWFVALEEIEDPKLREQLGAKYTVKGFCFMDEKEE